MNCAGHVSRSIDRSGVVSSNYKDDEANYEGVEYATGKRSERKEKMKKPTLMGPSNLGSTRSVALMSAALSLP